jgi:pseudaminic acid synthase
MTLKLGDLNVGTGYRPVIVAELSGNHNKSINRALQLIREAKKAGVDAVKFQTYTSDTMTLNYDGDAFKIRDKNNLWNGEHLYNLYERASTPWEWHEELFDECTKLNITPFSSPFDSTAVDLLEKLNCSVYKVSSFEVTDIPLIEYIGSTKKPIIMSTGMASKEEIAEAMDAGYSSGAPSILLLKCTSTYPADASNANLKTISDMKKTFQCEVGLSDHTLGISVSLAAIAKGACLIEKHLTINRKDGGVDSEFSLEPQEFENLTREAKIVFRSIGKVKYGPADEKEAVSKKYRRSIYASRKIIKGEIFSYENIKIVRPGLGLPPKEFKNIIGEKAQFDIEFGTPISYKMIS